MPEAQGKGVGQRLFDTVIEHVRHQSTGKARIELNVNKYNKAVDFYKHLGMYVALEQYFPIGGGFYKTDYIMALNLF